MKFFSQTNNKKILYFIFLLLFSISINQYYGNIGVFPIDSFLFFDSGYRTLNGYFPFKDFWTTTGPLLDIIQAIFFKIFGVSWFSYVLHASAFNFLIASATFYTLYKINLNINFSFLYAIFVSVIAYPIPGTPFPDHHSIIFSFLGLFSFILSLKTKSNFYWFLIPIFFVLAFLSKQTPAAYIGFIVVIALCVYFIFNFSIKKILLLVSGFLSITTLSFLFFYLNKIPFLYFFEQYFLFPLTIGDARVSEFLFPLEFKRLIMRFKLIHLSQLILLVLLIKKIINNLNFFKDKEFLILSTLVLTSYALISHQLLTLNQKFIFFIIPILLGFSHVYYENYFIKKNYIIYLLVIFGVVSTMYYKISYGDNRRFMELANVDLNKSISADTIDASLKNLKWINHSYSNKPNIEIENLKKSIKFLKNDTSKKMIITHYQFIASLMPDNVSSPSRFYTSDGVSYPKKGEKYLKNYKNFFIKQIIDKRIEIIYTIKPLEKSVFSFFMKEDCFKTSKINDILDSHLILNCDELRKKL